MLAALRGTLRGIADRLRGIRYFLGDVLYVLARFPRAVARGVDGFWWSLPVTARRRLVAALGVAASVLVVVTLVVPNLPCEFPAGDECPPPDDAIALTPAAALAYVHANVESDSDEAGDAREVASRVPTAIRQILLDAGAPVGAATEPWFTGEAAVVVLGAARQDRVQLLETSDPDEARAYAESLATGVAETTRYRDVEVTDDRAGASSAVVEGFLALGSSAGVRAVIDVATRAEGADSLGDDPTATRALEELPEHRFADGYLSAAGIEALIGEPEGSLASFEPIVDSAASRGVAIGLSAHGEGFSLAVRSVLDAERAEADPGFFAAFDEFEPELPGELAPETLAYLGIGEPGETVTALLRQATVRAPGIAAGVTDLADRLRGVADVDLQRDLLRALGGEAALAVSPRGPIAPEGQEQGEPLPAEPAPTPYLEFLADDVDEEAARDAMARLQGPIAQSLDPQLGAPSFNQREFGDVRAQVLRLSPVAELIYAIADSRLAIANDGAAIERFAEGGGDALAGTDRYERTVEELPDEPALIAYLDLRGLLGYAEQSGLAADPAYSRFATDLRRLSSFGLTVSEGDGVLATDARLLID